MEGFEPPKAEPESAVLPLHYIPKVTQVSYRKLNNLSILIFKIF